MADIDTIGNLIKHFGKEFAAGDHIFYDGDQGSEFYLVHDGQVRIYKVIKGKERTLALMKKDDMFGEVSALTGCRRTASAVTTVPTTVVIIPVPIFEKIAESRPEAAVRMMRRMARRLKAADDLIMILMEDDPHVRAVLGLLRLMESDGEKRDKGVELRFDVQDFCDQIEIGPDAVETVIQELLRKKIIRREGEGAIFVRTADQLVEYCRFLELSRKFTPEE